MKILMIASFLPYPLSSGGHIRLYNLLKALRSDHEITLICEKRGNQTDSDVKEIEEICEKVIPVKRRGQWSARNLFNTAVSTHSFLVIGHTNEEMLNRIKQELAANKFDLIHAETFYISQNIPLVSIPIVLVEHNIEYLVYSRLAKTVNLLFRPFLSYDAYKMKKEEQNSWKKASRLVVVSDEDKLEAQSSGMNAAIVPNGVNLDQFSLKEVKKAVTQKEKKILFIGDFNWIQNRDSLSWIIKEIWPLIRSKIKDQRSKIDAKLWIVGKNIPDYFKSLSDDPDIILDEKSAVRPAEEIFQEAYILLAPIRVGGGTSYKILEALSVGTPVVITPLSARSLGVRNFQEALVGETSVELGDKTLELLKNIVLYNKLSINGRVLIEKNYTWKSISKKLNEVYRIVV